MTKILFHTAKFEVHLSLLKAIINKKLVMPNTLYSI